MIACENVGKAYAHGKKSKQVLENINFTVGRGERLGLLGRNGAGKSTLIKLLGGIEMPSEGRVRRDMTISWPLALTGGFQGSLTGYDNARFIARIYDREFSDVRAFVEDFTELGRQLSMPMKTYSSGMRARLAFALSLAIEFDCYLIDEVIAVGDQNFARKCQHELFEKRADRAIILASHNTDVVSNLCHQALVLDHGRGTIYQDVHEAIATYNEL
ncbi:MAG: ABC transporter ATP-binding protein [Pseudomonadota bacterium]|nr:ABC transporter ATP-binding protein [Pseudomonadota bacterium]